MSRKKDKINYFDIARTTEPINSYGIKEFKKIVKAERKKKDGRVNNGGARPGSGPKKTKEPTVVMRVPVSLVEAMKKLIARQVKSRLQFQRQPKPSKP